VSRPGAAPEGGSPAGVDPITFEVVKNSFTNIADQMAEQILRTCHSFVIYSRDFSSALCAPNGDTFAQGTEDFAGVVGTLHLSAKAILERFGDTMAEGDVYAMNDPYLGSTHFNDVKLARPIFHDGELLALAQASGHWADVGGSVPGSFDVTLAEYYGGGMRIPPVRVWDRGVLRHDVVEMLVANMRVPDDARGDLIAQAEATTIAEAELHRLCDRYGADTVRRCIAGVQDHTETLTRNRIAELPDGTWSNVDYLDSDPGAGEGLIPIHLKMTIDGDRISYDLSGSHPAVRSLYNATYAASFTAVVGATKIFFPDLPLNSGFYRAIDFDAGPPGSVVNAEAPVAVGGMGMPYEKAMSAAIELWSGVMPERAMACAFNIEYLQVGGSDGRSAERPYFMWYDWLPGGWGGRNGRDGVAATSAVFGPSLASQPVEGQERLAPVLVEEMALAEDSPGPGRSRGGSGVRKRARLRGLDRARVSYICDRERSIVWGSGGGLPSIPHGLWLASADGEERYLGAFFSGLELRDGDVLTRPSAGGGGAGDPLERDPDAVREDVVDGYVSIARARSDYGVVVVELDAELSEYEVDEVGTRRERTRLAAERGARRAEDPEAVAVRYRAGELDALDLVRHYGVIVDWGSGELLPRSTDAFRAALAAHSAAGSEA
jgi:N-methylhydantoinase B